MLCDRCKKNEATIHVKKVLNGKIESMHLCAECAKEKEENGVLGAFGFNLAEVLFNIGELSKASLKKGSGDPDKALRIPAGQEISCPLCGWNLEKLQESNGQLGCPGCYQSFAPIITDALNRIQRSKVHTGKRPGGLKEGVNPAVLRLEMEQLKKELAVCIKKEEYEQAATLRDKLNSLKEKLAALGKEESGR